MSSVISSSSLLRKSHIAAQPQFRDIRSGRPKLIRKYITKLGLLLSTSDIPTRVDSLHDCNDIHLAETLDEEITAGMKSAEKKCETTKRLPRSGKLHEAQTRLCIYQKLLTQIRTMSAQILKRQEQLPQSIPLPSSLAETNAKLRASQREVRELSRKAFDLRNQQKEELANAIATVKGTSKKRPSNAYNAPNTPRRCSLGYPA
jgi:vacuolar-type H+-ATPase subunit I/STV1